MGINFFKNAWATVTKVANRDMNSKAEIILAELKAECPRSAEGHDGKHVRDSFKILGRKEGALAEGSFKTGLIRSIRIGSNELGAYYANYGNGGPYRIISPTRAKALHLKDGTYAAKVHGYNGEHFIERVAARHR